VQPERNGTGHDSTAFQVDVYRFGFDRRKRSPGDSQQRLTDAVHLRPAPILARP